MTSGHRDPEGWQAQGSLLRVSCLVVRLVLVIMTAEQGMCWKVLDLPRVVSQRETVCCGPNSVEMFMSSEVCYPNCTALHLWHSAPLSLTTILTPAEDVLESVCFLQHRGWPLRLIPELHCHGGPNTKHTMWHVHCRRRRH